MNANHRQKENRLAGYETAQMKTGGLSLPSIPDRPTIRTTRKTYVLPYDVDRLVREERGPAEYELDRKTRQAATAYFEESMVWALNHLDEVRDALAEIPYCDCESIAEELMRAPAIFWNVTPHPMTLDTYTAWVVTGYIAAGIRVANREVQARAEANHRAFYATVQAHLKDPRSYAEIEQARRVA